MHVAIPVSALITRKPSLEVAHKLAGVWCDRYRS